MTLSHSQGSNEIPGNTEDRKSLSSLLRSFCVSDCHCSAHTSREI